MNPNAFPKGALSIFSQIKKNNKREWWVANKARYIELIDQPTQKLISALLTQPMVRKLGLTGDPKKALFRMHRDVRFSHDKSPLKTSNGFLLSRNGAKDDSGVLYVHLEPKKCFLAAGFWHPDQSLLNRFRLEMAENQSAFRKTLAQLSKNKLKLEDDEALKRMPRGFEAYAQSQVATELKFKNIITSEPFSDASLETKNFAEAIDRFLKKASSLLLWGWPIVDEWREEGGGKQW
jgi:uncharacterized protein (TIGR02453 family)